MKIIAPRPDQFVSAEHHRLHDQLAGVATDITAAGTTANRPQKGLYLGKFYFDTTLGVPIWYDDNVTTGWCDATGTAA